MSDTDHMEDRLDALMDPDEMHPVGCASWEAEAVAFLEILDARYRPLVRNDAPFADALRRFIDRWIETGGATKVDVVVALLAELRRLNDQKVAHEVLKVIAARNEAVR